MSLSEERVNAITEQVGRIRLITPFTKDETCILHGRIGVMIAQTGGCLEWDVTIPPYYPLKVMGIEPITFFNSSLISYPHVMRQGNLCLHTPEYDNAELQLSFDYEQLIEWVDTYYVGGKKDEHYDHLVVEEKEIKGEYYSFAFSDTVNDFEDEDYGHVNYAKLMIGNHLEKPVKNFVIQKFISHKQFKKREIECNISTAYKKFESYYGIYCLLKDAPAKHQKFIVEDFLELETFLTQQQKNFIHRFEEEYKQQHGFFPLLCGYRIPDGSIHWQAIILFLDQLPIEPFYIKVGKQRIWHTRFIAGSIDWAKTENISYKYFFGRGSMPEKLANSKILIIGIGAIGSIIAETLTRCGAKNITLYDIQYKEYGNVCRSAYHFFNGITTKTSELESILCQISPHLECRSFKQGLDMAIKAFAAAQNNDENENFFNEYDFVFDCTTDNQLMQIIERNSTKPVVVNLSITNYAQDLVCAFSPRITESIRMMYSLLNRDTEDDLFNPTGCWNPTFKASYNDISSKVQYALKHIISMLCQQKPLHSFYVSEDNLNQTIHYL